VKPGNYRLRSVLRESAGKQLTAQNLAAAIPGKQSNDREKPSSRNSGWSPPKVDAPLKSLSTTPTCDLSNVLVHTAANAQALASNLEKFTAQEHIDYATLDRAGMVEEYDSSSFQYVYSIERHNDGVVSREYRTPVKGSHAFRESGQDIGQVAIALIFLPELQPDYEMKCEGINERNGQLDWVIHFQQRKDRPSRTASFWVNRVAHPGMFKSRAWISQENFQIVHLEANLIGGVPDIGLQELAVSVDYGLVKTPTGKLVLWLPSSAATYWDYDAHRTILSHSFSDFELFAVETKEKIQEPKTH
jgi:hypothetical protein